MGAEETRYIDVDEIKVLTIDDELNKRSKFAELVEERLDDNNIKVIKLDSEICVIPAPIEASQAFHLLSWQRLTMCLICEAIAIGCLSMPAVFATLGMFWGVVATVIIGLATTYTSLIVGETQFRNAHIKNYAEMGGLLFGNTGNVIVATMLLMLLILATGGHVLTGIIAFQSFFDHRLCSVIFGVISAVILFLLALPKTFHQMAILAYVDFASITIAVIMTMIVSAIESSTKAGGMAATEWYLFLPAHHRPDFIKVMLSITNITLAYAIAHCLPSFMSELKRPQDYRKSLGVLGFIQIVFYTVVGSTIYAFKGQGVKAPAVLSVSPLMQKIIFGIALPVIFISGSINGQTASKYIYDKIFLHTRHQYMDTATGKLAWIGIGAVVTIAAWVAAEVIPSFSTFLGLLGALFATCFTFLLPTCMYFKLLRKEPGRVSSNYWMLVEFIFNAILLAFGLTVLFAGTACCIITLRRDFIAGVSAPFSC